MPQAGQLNKKHLPQKRKPQLQSICLHLCFFGSIKSGGVTIDFYLIIR